MPSKEPDLVFENLVFELVPDDPERDHPCELCAFDQYKECPNSECGNGHFKIISYEVIKNEK